MNRTSTVYIDRISTLASSTLVAAALFGTTVASASSLGTGPQAPTSIFNGTVTDLCGWPVIATVSFPRLSCSATLIHPQVLSLAAHCMYFEDDLRGDVLFTEDQHFFDEDNDTPLGTPEQIYTTGATCYRNPAFVSYQSSRAHDYGYCVLDEPVDLPVSPIAYGCERDAIQVGAPVTLVGFGAKSGKSDGWHLKRWGTNTVRTLTDGETSLPSIPQGDRENSGPCNGDSGSPVFIQVSDGTLRPFAVVSGGEQFWCSTAGLYSRVDRPQVVNWIEQESGIDITPCHDADGTWNPTPMCGGFSDAREQGSGDWTNMCEGTKVTGLSSTCGAAFDRSRDAAPPEVQVSAPADGDVYDPGAFPGEVQASATDPDGWPVRRGWLEVDGAVHGTRIAGETFAFDGVTLTDGTHELVVVAEDWSGNVGRSPAVRVHVGVPAETTGGGSGEGSGDDGPVSETGSGTSGAVATTAGTGETGEGQSSEGGCRAGTRPRGAWLALGVLVRLRRRRGS